MSFTDRLFYNRLLSQLYIVNAYRFENTSCEKVKLASSASVA